jgi:CRISPR-associated endoribonuclease Cas6
MRIRLIFWLRNRGAVIPFHHQHLLYAMVSDILKEHTDKPAWEYLNFSGLKGQTKVTPGGLSFLSSKVTLVFSASSKGLVEEFIQNVFQRDTIRLEEMILVPESVAIEEEPALGEAVKYVCISPLIIASERIAQLDLKKFISPEIDTFSDLLYESTMSRMEHSGLYTPQQIQDFFKFQIVPDDTYLDKIKHEHKKFARIYNVDGEGYGEEVRGYTMPFTLFAHSDVQHFVFNSGLGEYTYKGFGMVDLADENFQSRLTPYEIKSEVTIQSNYRSREKVV